MDRDRRPRWLPSPAMIVALVALFIALGGSSYAAIVLPASSVGTKQLKKNAVTAAKVKDDTLTGKDIKESTLGTVPRATKADTATTATDAAHAASADTATNAGALGGIGPGVFGTSVRIAGVAFHADADTLVYTYESWGGLNYTSGSGHFISYLQLPQGAKVTSFTMFYANDTAASTGTLYLYIVDQTGAGSTESVSGGTAAGFGSATHIYATPFTVDNTTKAYYLMFSPITPNNDLYGAQVNYTLP